MEERMGSAIRSGSANKALRRAARAHAPDTNRPAFDDMKGGMKYLDPAMIEDATLEASSMAENRPRKSPRKSKLAEQFEEAGFALEDTKYRVIAPRGEHFDLRRLLARVDRAYFGADRPFALPDVAWAPLDAHNAWAVYVIKDDRILVEKSLDDGKTPAFVIEYLLMHEMLHLVHPPDDLDGEPEWHSEPFEAAIERFKRGDDAEKWLDRRLAAELKAKRARRRQTADT
jgi:hypothetical protein